MWYIYKITNLITNKSYVGQRLFNKSPLEDYYMGSGVYLKYSIKKHGRQNFKKEILIKGPSETVTFSAIGPKGDLETEKLTVLIPQYELIKNDMLVLQTQKKYKLRE
jgi:hypothetical protein